MQGFTNPGEPRPAEHKAVGGYGLTGEAAMGTVRPAPLPVVDRQSELWPSSNKRGPVASKVLRG